MLSLMLEATAVSATLLLVFCLLSSSLHERYFDLNQF